MLSKAWFQLSADMSYVPAHHPQASPSPSRKATSWPCCALQLSALNPSARGSVKPSPCSTPSSLQSRMPRASASPHCPAPGCQAAHPGGQGPDERQGADHPRTGVVSPWPVAGGPGGQHGQAGVSELPLPPPSRQQVRRHPVPSSTPSSPSARPPGTAWIPAWSGWWRPQPSGSSNPGQDHGKVDMRDLGTLLTVKAGELLMRRHPATQGIDGFTVDGPDPDRPPRQGERHDAGDGTCLPEIGPAAGDTPGAPLSGACRDAGQSRCSTSNGSTSRHGHVEFEGSPCWSQGRHARHARQDQQMTW